MAGQEYKRHLLNTLCSSRYHIFWSNKKMTVELEPVDVGCVTLWFHLL